MARLEGADGGGVNADEPVAGNGGGPAIELVARRDSVTTDEVETAGGAGAADELVAGGNGGALFKLVVAGELDGREGGRAKVEVDTRVEPVVDIGFGTANELVTRDDRKGCEIVAGAELNVGGRGG